MQDWSTSNLLAWNLWAWTEQAFLLAALGSFLLLAFRVRHPGTKLAYCHALLAVCVLLPWIQPWRHPTGASPTPASFGTGARLILWILAAGVAAKLGWLLAGLWRIRKCRISSMPMYPIPESVRAASAVTQADALFCVSAEVPGPVMLGWLTPVVLMPDSFLTLAEEAQCGVACHELLHVRRHDWLITVVEELAGTALWFNPAIWPLLAQARLAREQLVDAEVVRLTASRDSYIDALLSIARGGSGLDLAPAPLFLRRRHLTQRVHLLLKDSVASNLRLISSYACITAMLAVAGWFGVTAFPLIGRAATPPEAGPVTATLPAAVMPLPEGAPAPPPPAAMPQASSAAELPADGLPKDDLPKEDTDTYAYLPSAPIPPDPHELVTGCIRALTSPAEADAARARLAQARQKARLNTASTPPYRFDVSFTAAGSVANTGPGQLTEIRMPGQRRWTADLAGFSVIRWTAAGRTVENQHASIVPMRVQTLRDAIHWADQTTTIGTSIRSAAARWNNRPATCLLFSNMSGAASRTPTRLWEETEFCLDDTTGLLQIESIAPGTYTVYEYGGNLQLQGRPVPDGIAIYTGGIPAAEAHLTIAAMNAADQSLLTPEPGTASEERMVNLQTHARFPMKAPNPLPAKLVQPVIVEATIDRTGAVVEEELCTAADPALAQAALDLVKTTRFRHQAWSQYQAYINVRFMPSQK